MTSIARMLAKQSLIAQKNEAQYQMLKNNASQRAMLSNPSFTGNLELANAYETSLNLENISNSVQLMAINAELNVLNDSKLNYYA